MKLNEKPKSKNIKIDTNNNNYSKTPTITPWYMLDIYDLTNRPNPNKLDQTLSSSSSSIIKNENNKKMNNKIITEVNNNDNESLLLKVNEKNNNKTKQDENKKYNNLSPVELKKRIKKIDQDINDFIIKDESDQIKLKETVKKCLKNEEEIKNLKMNASKVYNIAKNAISDIESNVDNALLPIGNNIEEYNNSTIAYVSIKKLELNHNDSLFTQSNELIVRHEKYIKLQLIKRLYLISFGNAYKEYVSIRKVDTNCDFGNIRDHLISRTYFMTTGKYHQNLRMINFDAEEDDLAN
jgi:hypothetical protein